MEDTNSASLEAGPVSAEVSCLLVSKCSERVKSGLVTKPTAGWEER